MRARYVTPRRKVPGGAKTPVRAPGNRRFAGRTVILATPQAPVGERISPEVVPLPGRPDDDGRGSMIGLVANDAPLLPHQCDRLAQQAALGVARTAGAGENSSGDLFLAFATGNTSLGAATRTVALAMLPSERIDPLFYAAIEATEAAIVSALLAAETMIGRDGVTARALEPELLVSALRS